MYLMYEMKCIFPARLYVTTANLLGSNQPLSSQFRTMEGRPRGYLPGTLLHLRFRATANIVSQSRPEVTGFLIDAL